MNDCRHTAALEKWFDRGEAMPDELNAHVTDCAACTAHLSFLRDSRELFRAAAERPAAVPVDAERFLREFRERRETSSRSVNRRWALASLVTAAFVAAVALMSIVTPARAPVEARSFVESASSDVEGATTGAYHAEDGTAIVWVNIPEGDMW